MPSVMDGLGAAAVISAPNALETRTVTLRITAHTTPPDTPPVGREIDELQHIASQLPFVTQREAVRRGANLIAAQAARIAAVEAERDAWVQQYDRAQVRIGEYARQAVAAEARVSVLEGALRHVREFVDAENENRNGSGALMTDYENEAKEALDRIDAALA